MGKACIRRTPVGVISTVSAKTQPVALDRLGDTEPINKAFQIKLLKDRSVRIYRYDFPPTLR